jgi:nicotinate-nucleotide--dimethylbenzimidazole phosphoribosyltransferase
LGRLEQIAEWLAAWQGRHPPRVERIQIIVFAANHGVAARGVSAFPSAVTAQMVANFTASGAAINQLSGWLDATLNVVPLALDEPTGDITQETALDEAACLAALDATADLVCLGEMGIGNTTIASALSAALYGGTGADWAGRGTGIDDAGLARKADAIDTALALHRDHLDDGPGVSPSVLMRLGEPYVSPPRKSGRMGLGVFIAKTLLERTGASMAFFNGRQHGARIVFTWPRQVLEALSADQRDGSLKGKG